MYQARMFWSSKQRRQRIIQYDGIKQFFCMSQFHCTQATATVLSQDQDRPSPEGATLSLCKYASELAGYGVNSVIARSIFLFLYILQGRNHDETFVRRHMTT